MMVSVYIKFLPEISPVSFQAKYYLFFDIFFDKLNFDNASTSDCIKATHMCLVPGQLSK